LWLAFSKRATRIVKPYGIHVRGRWWTCDALSARSGETIGILEGRFFDWPVVPLYDLADQKTIIGYAEPHEAVDGLDPANAKEQRRREQLYTARGRALIASAGPYDPIADTHAMAALLPPPPTAPIAGTIVPNPQAAEIVSNVAEHPVRRKTRKLAGAELAQLRESERLARGRVRLDRLSRKGGT
jgi:hypothetical protein